MIYFRTGRPSFVSQELFISNPQITIQRMEVANDPDSEWPGTPQRGDVVDKLLKKLLSKPAGGAPVEYQTDSHENVGSGGPKPTAGSYNSQKPRVARVAQQLASAREALRSAGVPSDAACRVAALEAKLYQLETDTVAAVAAKRRAEHDLMAAKAQISAMSKSSSLQKADWDQALEFLRSQVDSKSQEAARLESQVKKQAAQLAQLQQENERQQETSFSIQKRLRERVAALERQVDEAKESLHAAEGHAATMEISKTSLFQSKSSLEEENSKLKERVETLRREVGALREELTSAREQLESALLRATGSREAEEALRDAVAQRAAATQDNRNLRGEVCRLQSALLEEKAAKEQLKHKAELKLTAATHEATSLREKLEAKIDETKASKAIINSLKADADRAKDTHEALVDSLKEKLTEVRRANEDARRRTAEEMHEAEAKWEEKTHNAIEQAVSRHQRRIQDLELQLAHPAAGAARAASGPNGSVGSKGNDNLYIGGHPTGYAASILDYIPRAEHLRLLECRTAAREAEARAEIAAVKAAAVAEGQARTAAVSQELKETKNKLHKAVVAEAEQQERAARAEHRVTMLRVQCAETTQQLTKAKEQCRENGEKVVQLEKELAKQISQYEKATFEAAEALKIEKSRGDKACAGLEVAVAAAKASEEAAKTVETRRVELESTLTEKLARCDTLSNQVLKLQTDVARAEEATAELQRTATATAERARTLQERCVVAEQERDTLQTRLETLKMELEQGKNAAIAFREESTRRAQTEISNLLSRIETSLGMAVPPLCTAADQQQQQLNTNNGASSVEARLEMVLSKCRQQQAEATASQLAAQRAEQEAVAAQARQVALEQHYLQAQQQYLADMATLERDACEQVKGVKYEAEQAIAGLRRASTLLHEQVATRRTTTADNNINSNFNNSNGFAADNSASFISSTCYTGVQNSGGGGGHQVERAGSLASEVEELKLRLAQQAQQADAMEKQEQAFAALLSQLTQRNTLTNGAAIPLQPVLAGAAAAPAVPAAAGPTSQDGITFLHCKKQA